MRGSTDATLRLFYFFSIFFFSFFLFFILFFNRIKLRQPTYQPWLTSTTNNDRFPLLLSIYIYIYYRSFGVESPCSPCTKINFSCCRWTSVQVPSTGLRAGVHSIIEFAATPSESRRPGGTGEEPAVPLQHLRQRLRHRIQPSYPHVEGQSCMYQIRRPTTTGILAT